MGYLDRSTEAVFADQEDGSTIYFPNGIFGPGRIITCEKRKKEVFIAHRRSIIFGVFVGVILGLAPLQLIWLGFSLIYAYGIAVVVCVAFTGMQVYLNRVRVADLPQTDIKMNVKSARAKSFRTLPLIYWKMSLGFGLVMMPLYFTLRLWFPDQLGPHEKTTKYALSMVVLALLITCQGWYGYQSYKIEEPTLKFRETQLEDINCEDEKEQIEELIIKGQQPDPSDTLDSV